MNKRWRQICLFLLVVWPMSVFALTLPERPSGYVNDYAGVLSQPTRKALEQHLAAFERSDSTQIVVAIFPSLDGGNIEDIGIRLADKWRIGQADKDNGVILLVFPQDRQLRIETGYGLEDRLTDAISSAIIRNEIAPRFRQNDFDGGIIAGVNAIQAAVRGAYQGKPNEKSGKRGGVSWLFILLILLFFFFPRGRRAQRFSSAGLTALFLSGLLGGGGRHRGGGGFGGFGGGGGGGFGGGGASGRW